MHRFAILAGALSIIACASTQGPRVFNESSHPITLAITWKNGVTCPPISLAPGGVLWAQADEQPPRTLAITYMANALPKTEDLELREWVRVDATTSKARPWAAFMVSDTGAQPVTADALHASSRAPLAASAASVDPDALGLREAFDRELDEALQAIRSRVQVGQSRREVEAVLASLQLASSTREGKLTASFYPTSEFPCLVSGKLEVTFDASELATAVVVDEDAMCL